MRERGTKALGLGQKRNQAIKMREAQLSRLRLASNVGAKNGAVLLFVGSNK